MDGKKSWKGSTGGTTWMQRSLIVMLKLVPLKVMYSFVTVCIIPFYMLFCHQSYIAIYHFFRQRMKWSVLKSFIGVWRNHSNFAQVVLDRFYMYGGGHFQFTIDNYDLYKQLAAQPGGFVILSAHVGNYEVAGYTLVAETKRFNAVVYGGETETVMQNRARILGGNNIRMIPLRDDMSHLFMISNALSDGESVSIPGDRIFGSSRTVTCRFMDADAKFPLGPFAVAAQREVPVLAINVMKESTHRYHIFINQLEAGEGNIKQRAARLAHQYANNLEKTVRLYPTQWYNYYEFWS